MYANFYDESSFEYALKCLCKNRYQNAIVYIAAHAKVFGMRGDFLLDEDEQDDDDDEDNDD